MVLAPVLSGQAQVAECYAYGSGYAWGQVAIASVVLGKEPPVTVPVHLIDAAFGTLHPPSPCNGTVWQSPSDPHAQVNGVLGIDVERGESGDYFACRNGMCTPLQVPNSERVVNPVRSLERQGALVFQGKQCRNCHSLAGSGGQRGPALDSVAVRLTQDQLIRQVIQGGGNMPAYGKNLSPPETTALVAFLETLHPAGQVPARDASRSLAGAQ
jgi:mono/diheme cytochrome c family protein